MPRGRIHQLIAAGLMVTVGLAATSGCASAPARGEESSAQPPVERVARELRSAATSVIVFVSVGGKEYVATAGARRPSADQRFRVWSVTKTFTATIVLKLVEEQKLRLESTLEDHVPGVIPRGDEITIRQLLQHRSGLADYTNYPSWLERAVPSPSTRPIDSLRFAGSKPLVFEPGSQGSYSNTNYMALGLVIEKVTGHSYAQELEQRILKPLGLDHTEMPQTRRLPDLDDGGYNPNLPWADGAIVSNAHDLSRFYSALLSGRILSSATLATMKNVDGVGLGIFSTELACGRAWGHTGSAPDYSTLVSASEEGDRVVVVSLHGPGNLPSVERALLCAEPRPAAGSEQASWKISFNSSDRGTGPLYVMNANGSGQRWLTLSAAGPPAWSPDGGRIAFATPRHAGSQEEIYVMNADGSGQRRLTRSPALDRFPAWSPDGRKLLFHRQRSTGGGLWVMNADGSGQRRLAAGFWPGIWSPDGRKVLFSRGSSSRREVYVVNADGSGQRNLTRHPTPDRFPAWSPDGRKIAFDSDRDGNGEIYVMNTDGSAPHPLTRNPAHEHSPAWSPDGRKIAFVSDRDGNGEIYLMNADGSRQRRLTRNPASDGSPAWSPDGRRIGFVSERDGNPEIYVMNTDGSGQQNLTRSLTGEFWFAWSPVRKK